ncbi:MAG: PAS domain S-box protein, partial [Candidatus Thiodiazotropha sp. (ex Notomyrtea botanica)]|nr:PAS domain S-box protein [Candidatus Thiodiazotropha sp. (ex Notomyrtea botanica)]
ENPPRATLRIATPVIDTERNRHGIIVINIAMRYLFNLVQNSTEMGLPTQYFLLNQKGELLNSWVEHAQTSDSLEQEIDFPVSHPEIWQKISQVDSGNEETLDGFWTWKTLAPVDTFKRLTRSLPEHSAVFDKLISDDFSLTLLAHRPITYLVDMRQRSRVMISLGMLLGVCIYGFALFLYLNNHVRTRRAELHAAYAFARASNMERLKELEERFHHLVEASSIGQLVVNDTGQIEISNHAANGILGYESRELEGQSVDTLLPSDLQNQHIRMREQYLRQPEARKMGEGRELMAMKKDGSNISVEVGLNPYVDQGRRLILVSIIDLSVHKKH